MIFELKNKIPRNSSFLRGEDVLTSITFGNLRYFSNQNILIDFLNESIDLNKNKLYLKKNQLYNIHFWEKHYNDNSRRYNETDLLLENKETVIIIECKYHSPLSEEYETYEDKIINYSNQLIRYSKIFSDEKYNELNKNLIYLTEDKTIPKDILIKTKSKIDTNIFLYWLSWNKLYLALIKQENIIPQNEKLLFNDLLAFLTKRRMITFRGFANSKVICKFHYRKQYKYINWKPNVIWQYKKCYKYINNEIKHSWRYGK